MPKDIIKDRKDTKEDKEVKDSKDSKESKESKDAKEVKDDKDGKDENKEIKELKDDKDDKDGPGHRTNKWLSLEGLELKRVADTSQFAPHGLAGGSPLATGRSFIRAEERPSVGDRLVEFNSQRLTIVLARQHDAVARALVDRWGPGLARLMTPDDLSTAGWRQRFPPDGTQRVVASGEVLDQSAVAGVVVLLPLVSDLDLPHIRFDDRAYVAAEMSAFLRAWLTSLECPVLNKPSSLSLSGPGWRPEQWALAADRLGIRARAVRRVVAASNGWTEDMSRDGASVTVVGPRALGIVDDALLRASEALAKDAGVELASFRFSSSRPDAELLSASLWPDISSELVADAIHAFFEGALARAS